MVENFIMIIVKIGLIWNVKIFDKIIVLIIVLIFLVSDLFNVWIVVILFNMMVCVDNGI